MAGNIQKLGDQRYRIRVFKGRDETGKQLFFTEVVRGTKKQAEAHLRARLLENDTGQLPVKKTKTFVSDFLNDWLKAQVQVKERTLATYRMYCERYIQPHIGQMRLDHVTSDTVQDLVHTLGAQGLSSSVVRYTVMVVKAALTHAVKKGLIPHNPVDLQRNSRTVNLPKLQRQTPGALDVDQARKFIEAARGNKWGTLLVLAVVSGLRPGELQGLMWCDVDWENDTLHVARAVEWPTPTEWRIGAPKTDAGTRSVLLPATVMQMLREHQDVQGTEREKVGEHYDDHGFIFANERGGPFNRKNVIRRSLRPVLEAAGLPANLRLYDLRHSAATVDMMLGVPAKVVSEKLGHTNPGFTLKTYSHVKPALQREAVRKLSSALFSDGQAPE